MDGINIKRDNKELADKPELSLLLEHDDLEIMIQNIYKNSLVWITPAENSNVTEFFYIIKGNLTLESFDETVYLEENDCFYIKDLKQEILLKSNTDLKLLYVTTSPIFHSLEKFYGDINSLLDRLNEKDKYTKEHSKRVADYCLFLSKKLKCTDTVLDNLVIASLFHDIGKCFIPESILTKPGRLTQEEFKQIYKHPVYSKKLISGKFNEQVHSIIIAHHERLDGSGYPYNLKGEEIPFEARIIAVADSFDAMTSDRPYNTPMSYKDAANELYSLKNKYDIRITKALKKMVDTGELERLIAEVNNDRI